MKYKSAKEKAKEWDLSPRTVRNYCAQGKIPGAFLVGKTWNIPEDAQPPKRKAKEKNKARTLLEILKEEKQTQRKGGIYHKIQIELTYNSNHIEGSQLTHDQTRYIYETNTIGIENHPLNVDDIVETANHFRCIDKVIENAHKPLKENFIKELHYILKNGTSDGRKNWFAIGEYKKLPNEVGGKETTDPENVDQEMKKLLENYNKNPEKTLEEIIEFHQKFETIHPFQDGNGRIGRLILFKECLRNEIVPFIIDEKIKLYYYRGLSQWKEESGYLIETCLHAQDQMKEYLDKFQIEYKE